MKRLLLALLLPVLSMAQEDRINFNTSLHYQMKLENKTIDLDVYYSPDGFFLDAGDIKMLLKDYLVVPVNVNLNRMVNLSQYARLDSIPSFTLAKTDKKDSILGLSCTYYDIFLDGKPFEKSKMCISEKFYSSAMDLVGPLSAKNKNIKGLILKIGSEENGAGWFELKSMARTSAFISLDWQKILTELKDKSLALEDILKTVNYTTEEPFDYENNYPEVDSISTSFIYNIKTYNSEYKTSKIENTNLAINELEKDSPYWQGLPKYCANLEDKISGFSNKKLKKHIKNYIGQICDLYLSEIKENSVDVKRTLDEIRYEENYFRNYQTNKKDRNLINDFLNKLD